MAVIPFDGSPAIRPVPDVQFPFRWYRNSQTLATIKDQKAVSNVWAVSLAGDAPYPITHFEDQKILNFAFSPQGDRIACLRANLGSDVALFTRRRLR
jgi:hypothetical protein